MPLTLSVRGDTFPVAGTQWCQLCITFANWGQLARTLSHQFIIGVAYCDDKDATILANLRETIIKVCVTMCPSWLFTSDCSIDEWNFQLVQLNITTYNAPSSLSSCCKLSLTVQHLSGWGRRSIAKCGLGVMSRGCGDGWDYRNIGRSLVYMHLPFGKGLNVHHQCHLAYQCRGSHIPNGWWSLYATMWLYEATTHLFGPLAICTMYPPWPHGPRLFNLYIYRGFR